MVVYIYFNYQSRDTQSAIQITRSIIKQLISCVVIPEDLNSIYEKSIEQAKDPKIQELISILELCSRRFTTRFAVFDALDECSEQHKNEILDLFLDLQKFDYKLLISGRPTLADCHLSLSNVQALEIQATESDIEMYIIHRMKNKKVPKKVHDGCLELVKGANGM